MEIAQKFGGIILLFFVVSCSLKKEAQDGQISYSVTSVMPEDIQAIADSCNEEYTAVCSYEHMCAFCREDFPRVFAFCDTMPVNFYVLFVVRECDSVYIHESIQAIKKYDESFDNFLILSDSLFDPENKKRRNFLFFKEYGGHREGQKYIKYVDNYVPAGFDDGCYTPRLFLYRKRDGLVYVTHYDEQENTCLPQQDIKELTHIICR